MRIHTVAALAAAALVAAVTATAFAGDSRVSANPHKAAARLVAKLRAKSQRAHMTTFPAKVVSRRGRLWLVVTSTRFREFSTETHVRIYEWSGRAWTRQGVVVGDLGSGNWSEPSMTEHPPQSQA